VWVCQGECVSLRWRRGCKECPEPTRCSSTVTVTFSLKSDSTQTTSNATAATALIVPPGIIVLPGSCPDGDLAGMHAQSSNEHTCTAWKVIVLRSWNVGGGHAMWFQIIRSKAWIG